MCYDIGDEGFAAASSARRTAGLHVLRFPKAFRKAFFVWFQIFFITFALMKHYGNNILMSLAVAAGCALVTLTSCGEKKRNTGDIIAPKPVTVVKKSVQTMSGYKQNMAFEWLGQKYTFTVSRSADKTLPLTQDEVGNKYYDNIIEVSVRRADGTVFFSKVFKKTDFATCVSEESLRTGALLGVAFDRAEGDNVYFAASVGSPDRMSDSYVPIVVRLSRTGSLVYGLDTRLDISSRSDEEE